MAAQLPALSDHGLLLLGFMLPWLAGSTLLFALRRRLAIGALSACGYGFFIGAALLHLLQSASYQATGSISPSQILSVFAVLTALTLASGFMRKRQPVDTPGIVQEKPVSSGGWGSSILAAFITVHAALIAIELYFRPVFPWDAWQAWLYKAKAWFYAGGLVPVALPADWLSGTGPGLYNAPAGDYPGLVSSVAYWAALCLGTWSETRVNWPVFLCGASLCLGLGGQVLALTANRQLALIACFLFITTPLVTTHLSLAGYADLWLAGYTGLGFLALLRGLLNGQKGQYILGLAFLTLGLFVKNDAALWLVCAAALILLAHHPLSAAALLLGSVVLLALLNLLGGFMVSLPQDGSLGLRDSTLSLGPLGTWELQLNNVAAAYARHLFATDSWHLLWYLVALALGALVCVKRLHPFAKPLGGFLGLILVSQLFLFGFTSAGQWADDGTALNRLLLHPLPAVIAVLVVVYYYFMTNSGSVDNRNLARVLTGPIAASVLLFMGTLLWLYLQAGTERSARLFAPDDFRTISGKTTVANGELLVSGYQDNAAIISAGTVYLASGDLSLMKLGESRRGEGLKKFFWRQANSPETLQIAELSPGQSWLDLRKYPEWRGIISEVGLLVYPSPTESPAIRSLAIYPPSTQNLARMMVGQWFDHGRWSQASINVVQTSAGGTLVPVPLLVAVWLALGLAANALLPGGASGRGAIAGLILFAWIALDARWAHRNVEQAIATVRFYHNAKYPEALDMGFDEQTAEMASGLRDRLGENPATVVIAGHNTADRFRALRAKYLLLPHASYVHRGRLGAAPVDRMDALLLSGPEEMPERLNVANCHLRKVDEWYQAGLYRSHNL